MEKAEIQKYKEKLSSLFEQKKYDEALQLIVVEECKRPKDFDVLQAKVSVLYLLNKNEEAVTVADVAIAIKPDDYTVFHTKGCALYSLSKFLEAVTAFDACLHIRPNFDRAIKKKISSLILLGRHREAAYIYEDSDLSVIDGDISLNNLGYMYLELGDYDKAGHFLYSAKILNPFEPVIYYNLSRIYEKLNNRKKFLKHKIAFRTLLFLEKIGFRKRLVKHAIRRELPVGAVFFDGPGKLYKTKGQALETRAILKLLRGLNAAALCNGSWQWFAVNIPYQAVDKNNAFNGDIDIILKRPRYFGDYDAGFTYRGFQVKVALVSQFGKIEKIHKGISKYKDIKKQLNVLNNFGCEQIFMVEIFILERGYSMHNNFPSNNIKKEIMEKEKYLKELGYGYVVMAEEPSSTNDDESGGIAYMPINVLLASTHPIGLNFQKLVDGIDSFLVDSSTTTLLRSLSRQESFGSNVGYCSGCKSLTMIVPVGFTSHICGFCKKSFY